MLRYRSGASPAYGLAALLQQFFGYRANVDGNDACVADSDVSLKRGPRPVLELGREIPLHCLHSKDVAAQMLQNSPSIFEDFQPKIPKEIKILGGFGVSTDLEEVLVSVAIASKDQLHDTLAHKLLPFMMQRLGATHCAAVTVNGEEQQRRLSFTKIALLNERYGLEESKKLASERGALAQITPDPLSVLFSITVFFLFSPWALALPVNRRGTTWLFYKEDPWLFDRCASVGFLEQFQNSLEPRSVDAVAVTMRELRKIPLTDRWSYIRLVVRALDKLIRYVNDPRNFCSTDGYVDVLRQIQAMSAIKLLFADLRALNFSPQAHNRISYAFLAIDKLANLKGALGDHDVSEVEISKKLLSLSQWRELKRTFEDAAALSAGTVKTQLVASSRAFLDCHRHLQSQFGHGGLSEFRRLEALRTFRNLHHGTFLTRQAFEKFFLDSPAIVPPSLPSIPILLTLSMGVDPKRFFQFDPVIK